MVHCGAIVDDFRYSDPQSIGDLISSSTRGLSPLPVHESNQIAIGKYAQNIRPYLKLNVKSS
jgi:hypothetical protein